LAQVQRRGGTSMGAAGSTWSDSWPDDDKLLGSLEDLLRRGAPLFLSESQAAPRPRSEQAGRYLVNNSSLRAPTSGLGFRRSKQLQDYDSTAAPWGGFVLGYDEGDGWLRVEDRYLPMSVQGLQVLTYVGLAFVATLRLCIVSAAGLPTTNGSVPSPCVVARLGSDERRTPGVTNTWSPEWSTGNRFILQVQNTDSTLELEVLDCATADHLLLGRTTLSLRGIESRRWHRRRDRLEGGGFSELQYEVHLEPIEAVQMNAPQSPECSSPRSPLSQASSLHAAWPAAFPHLLQRPLSCMAPVAPVQPTVGHLQVPVQPASFRLRVDGLQAMQLPAPVPVPSLAAPMFPHNALAPVPAPCTAPLEGPDVDGAAATDLAALAERVDRVLRRCKLQLMKDSNRGTGHRHALASGQLQVVNTEPRARSLDRNGPGDQELYADLEEVALRLGCGTGRSRSAHNRRSSQVSLRLEALDSGVQGRFSQHAYHSRSSQAGREESSAVSLLPYNSLGSQVISRVPASGSTTKESRTRRGVAAILAAASHRSAVDPMADILAAAAPMSTTHSLSPSEDDLQPAKVVGQQNEFVDPSKVGGASEHHEDQSGQAISVEDPWHCEVSLTPPQDTLNVPALRGGNQSAASSDGLVAQVENHCAALEACMARVRRDKALRRRFAGTGADVA